MDFSNQSIDDLLTFDSLPESPAEGLGGAVLEQSLPGDFDFSAALNDDEPDYKADFDEFLSQHPPPFDNEQQPSYNENILDDPLSLYSTSSLSINQGLYEDPQANVQDPWTSDQELQTQFDWDYRQTPGQVRIQQEPNGYPNQDKVDQPKSLNLFDQILSGQAMNPAYLQNNRQDVTFKCQWSRLLAYSSYQGYTQPTPSANQWLEKLYSKTQGFRQQHPAKQERRQPVYQSKELYLSQAYTQFAELEIEPEQEIEPIKQRGKTSKALKASKMLDNAKNKRSANIANFKPEEHYEPLPQTTQSWGTINRDTRRPTFEYNARGELTPNLQFSKSILEEYLGHHFAWPLTLWVQICPADSGNRYSHQETSKCRFKDCPIKNNTILKGDYRVTFDEHASKPLRLDPFHNAGYVHLYCLEKQFDFPHLCKAFNVRPDIRVFPAEAANKMAITRDYPEMAQVVHDFIANSQTWKGQKWDYSKTLCYALTVESMKREPATRQVMREKRGGNSVDKHFNNLDIKAENMIRRKREMPLVIFEGPPIKNPESEPRQPCKRTFRDQEDECEGSARSPPKNSKVTKREPTSKPSSSTKKSRRQLTKKRTSGSSAAKSPTYEADASSFNGALTSTPLKTLKRKRGEEDERKSSVESFHNTANDQMKRCSLHKRHKGVTAGLNTPVGDIRYFGY